VRRDGTRCHTPQLAGSGGTALETSVELGDGLLPARPPGGDAVAAAGGRRRRRPAVLATRLKHRLAVGEAGLCGGQATRQTREPARAGRARLHAGSAVRDHTLHTCLRGVGAVTLARAGGRRGTAGLSTIPQRADAVPMRGAEGAAASDEGVTTMRSRAPGGEVAHPEGRDCGLLAGTVGRATYRFAGARLRHADGHGNGDRGGREGDSETPLHSVLPGTSRFPQSLRRD